MTTIDHLSSTIDAVVASRTRLDSALEKLGALTLDFEPPSTIRFARPGAARLAGLALASVASLLGEAAELVEGVADLTKPRDGVAGDVALDAALRTDDKEATTRRSLKVGGGARVESGPGPARRAGHVDGGSHPAKRTGRGKPKTSRRPSSAARAKRSR